MKCHTLFIENTSPEQKKRTKSKTNHMLSNTKRLRQQQHSIKMVGLPVQTAEVALFTNEWQMNSLKGLKRIWHLPNVKWA